MTGLWSALAVAALIALVTRMALTPTGREFGRWYTREWRQVWVLCRYMAAHPLGPVPMTPAPLPMAQAAATPAASEVPAPPPPSGAGASPDVPVAALFREFEHRAALETTGIPILPVEPPLRLRLYADPRFLLARHDRTLARDIAAGMVAADMRLHPGPDSARHRHPELSQRLAELSARRKELAGAA